MRSLQTKIVRGLVCGTAMSLALAGAAYADDPAKVDHSYPTPPPTYTAAAQAAGEQGDVMLRVFVMTDGRAHKIRVTKSSGFADLDQASVEAAGKYYYIPTLRSGGVINAWKSLKFHFELPKPADAAPASSGQ